MRAPTSTRGILASALVALMSGLGILTLIVGYSGNGVVRTLQFVAIIVLGAGLLTSVIVLSLVHFANWQSPASEDDFELIVRRTEQLAAEDPWTVDEFGEYGDTDEYDALELDSEEDFKALVRAAVDDLPLEFHRALEHVAIVVGDGGAAVRTGRGRRGAYGLYQGDTIVQNYFHDRIVIFRDTLMRDFGHDPDLLREQVTRTVRHELAHHLGWDERGVGGLGL
ncbi:MAG TPA: metallopeptidase family protein [Solirubrobacteraceae bacterium]|nr:metallopeptidase family protein [Solirubrobacteraceae bacterium]